MIILENLLNVLNTDPLLIIVTTCIIYLFVYFLFSITRSFVLFILKFFIPDSVFNVHLSMAERGHFKRDGLILFQTLLVFLVSCNLSDGKKVLKWLLVMLLNIKISLVELLSL